MDRQQAAMQIKGALDTVLKRDLDELTDETRLFEDLNLDSTSVIELLITIEEAIGLTVDVDELDPEVFTTVGSLTDFVAAMAMAV
ncbi:MAG TPA: phosphopantetheine-binding protein [Pseudonocardiaceae bacterium]|nr:phosphopantetheine-binding protein [Pseudonocardiaceae bacterium]